MADPEQTPDGIQYANHQTRTEQEHIFFKGTHAKAVVPYGYYPAGNSGAGALVPQQVASDGTVVTSGGGGGGGGGTTNSSNTIDAAPVTQNITAQDVGSVTVTTGANSQSSTTGTPTAGSVASFALAGYDSAAIQVTGTWTGTLIPQISFDSGTTWYNQGLHEIGTAYTAGSFTANFAGRVNAAGATNWRLQSTTAWTGTATVKVIATVNPAIVYLGNNSKLPDGTNPTITATVKAASTAPLGTDTSVVVAQSPNSPGATSSNQTSGNQQTKITNGTNIADVIAGDTGFNGVATNAGTKTISFTTSATGAQILGPFSTEGYAYATVNVTSAGTGLAWTGMWASASGGTYAGATTWYRSDQTSTITALLSTTTNIFSTSKVHANFFQLNISAMTGGTTTGTVTLTNAPLVPHTLGVAASLLTQAAQADGQTVTQASVQPQNYNNSSFDRNRNNITGVVIAAGATATNAGVSITTYNASKAVIILNVSAYTSGSLTVAVSGVSSSGYTYPILTSAAIAATGVVPLRISPALTASANAVTNDILPRTIQVAVSGTFSATYGIDYELSV